MGHCLWTDLTWPGGSTVRHSALKLRAKVAVPLPLPLPDPQELPSIAMGLTVRRGRLRIAVPRRNVD